MNDYGFIPDYTDVDFQTLVDRLKKILSKTDTFKDYDFEGANIAVLMELLAYIGDLNTFYTNRLAQNIHTETAQTYEVVHSLVKQQGYTPTGYSASEVVITIRIRRRNDEQTISYFNENDQLFIPKWFKVNTGLTDDNGNIIYYCMADDFTYICPVSFDTDYDNELEITYDYVEFDVTMRQGEPLQTPLEYTGADIVSNQIVLPFHNWDMGVYPYENYESVLVTIGDTEESWVRISDFFDDISGLVSEDDVYLFSYDKYKRSVIIFSNTRNVPNLDDDIKIYPIKTLGLDGSISQNIFGDDNKPVLDTVLGIIDVPFLNNITQDIIIPDDRYTVLNNNASVGGSMPENIDDLKIGGSSYSHSQLRNVTKIDYMGNLGSRGDITKATAWGEQEQNPNVLDTTYYNRAYISTIPTEWDTEVYNNIKMVDKTVDDEFSNNIVGNPLKTLLFPEEFGDGNIYNPTWETELIEYLEPRKMLGIWEEFILPELIYFRLDFGLKVKRTYSWTQVKETIKNKLIYYFSNSNRKFGDAIDFREIYNYIMDMSNISSTDDFPLIRGINSLVVRDVMIYRDPVRVGDIDNQSDCEYFDGTWTGTCSIVPDEMYIFSDNTRNYFPHFVNTGYFRSNRSSVDDVYNIIQPIKLGHNQFPQLASDFCIFVNEV